MKKFSALKRFVLASFFSALYIFLVSSSSAAQVMYRIVVTDVTGQREQLIEAKFVYSDHHENNMWGHLEIMLSGSLRQSLWIHHSQIKAVTFQAMKDAPRISVTIDSGQTFTGIFPDARLKISGKGDLGEVTYEVNKIKALEFLHFREGGIQNKIMDRQEASSEWKRSQESNVRYALGERKEEKKAEKKSKREEAIPSPPTVPRWTIVDGKTTIDAEGLGIRDSYDTNVSGFMRYFGRSFRRATTLDHVKVQRGASQSTISLGDLESLEFTGRKIGDNPEIIIQKKDGSNFTVGLLMTILDNGAGADAVNYGPPQGDDMLIWSTPYGFKGVSLVPLRKITVRAQKETK